MKRVWIALPALVVTAGCVLPPKDVTPEMMLAWDTAVTSVGCDLIGEPDFLPVELQTGLPRETVIEIAQYKVAIEEAVSLEGGGVRLVTGSCTPTTEPAATPATGA